MDHGSRDAEVGQLLLDEARGVFQRLGRHRLDGGRRRIQQRQVGQRGIFALVTVHRGGLRLADGGAFTHGFALDPDGLADVGVAVRCAAMRNVCGGCVAGTEGLGCALRSAPRRGRMRFLPCCACGGAASNRHVGIVIQPGLAKAGNGGLDRTMAIGDTFPAAGDGVLGSASDATQKAAEQAPTGRGLVGICRARKVAARCTIGIIRVGGMHALPPLGSSGDKTIQAGRCAGHAADHGIGSTSIAAAAPCPAALSRQGIVIQIDVVFVGFVGAGGAALGQSGRTDQRRTALVTVQIHGRTPQQVAPLTGRTRAGLTIGTSNEFLADVVDAAFQDSPGTLEDGHPGDARGQAEADGDEQQKRQRAADGSQHDVDGPGNQCPQQPPGGQGQIGAQVVETRAFQGAAPDQQQDEADPAFPGKTGRRQGLRRVGALADRAGATDRLGISQRQRARQLGFLMQPPVAGQHPQHEKEREQVGREPEQVQDEVGKPGTDAPAEVVDLAGGDGVRPARIDRVVAEQDQKEKDGKEAQDDPAGFPQQADGPPGKPDVPTGPVFIGGCLSCAARHRSLVLRKLGGTPDHTALTGDGTNPPGVSVVCGLSFRPDSC